jgi:hypothetical protein
MACEIRNQIMSKRITGVFDTHDGGRQAAQALLQHGIAPERLYMFAGKPVASAQQDQDVNAGEVAGATLGAGLAGLTSLLLPGIGILVGATAALATLGITAASSADEVPDQPIELEQLLMKLGFMQEHVQSYAQDVRQGRTLVAVDAEDEQTDLIADLFHEHGGQKLEFRRMVG